MTNIIAIDATLESSSVTLYCNSKYYMEYNNICNNKVDVILSMIKKVLIRANINLKDIHTLAYCNGPGNFTGIRITIGIAHGLTFGLNIPMIGISSLLTIAQGAYEISGIKQILVAIDAKMGELYCAKYIYTSKNQWNGKKTESLLHPSELIKIINNLYGNWGIAGNGWFLYPSLIQQTNITLLHTNVITPNAKDMIPIALYNWNNGKKITSPGKGMPNYIRNNVIQKNKRKNKNFLLKE
uniref:tRNA threonylcarbamoyladenosine biosynthesis protein TsaB n=1 Tax=Candidatus Aschnera chinzeii TaxID=1485666 RepID=A0AAT9G4A5_9ENTR|nr:MAG: tRNA (adenosine(37)-N6)-threonylcarbamoyltransferase complex dimerization subunit type 1 TsaB [Candidatus Aschnera chinzeii]